MSQSTNQRLHLAIIPDGNRRWARQRSLFPWQGHKQALETCRTLLEWCRQQPALGVLTLWCFSTENWNREPEEIRHLMRFLRDYLIQERSSFHKRKIRLLHSGRQDRLPKKLVMLLRDISQETAQYQEFTLHLAIDYGGKDEIVRAVKKIPSQQEITEDRIRQFVDQPSLPDIDIIIRTSGEMRTSNFFLWQSAYAEWFFLPNYFPDLTRADLQDIINRFQQRSRRFGA